MIGSNVPTVGGVLQAFEWAEKWGCECIQIYLYPSRRWNVPEWQSDMILAFRSTLEESSVQEVVGHVPYLVNLASADRELWARSVGRLRAELEMASILGVRFLVMHPGSHGPSSRSDGLRRIWEGLNLALDVTPQGDTALLLETTAGQGTAMGSRFEELAWLLDGVERRRRLGVCLDTAHVFAAGYDIRGYDGCSRVLRDFDAVIGLSALKVIHLNDSKADLGSMVDRHAGLSHGRLGLQVFHTLVRDSRFRYTPKIVEDPDRDENTAADLRLLRELAARTEPVTARPPGASQLRLWGGHEC